MKIIVLNISIFLIANCLSAQLPSNWIPIFTDEFHGNQLDTTLWATSFPWAKTFVSSNIFSKDYNENALFPLKNGHIELLERKTDLFQKRAVPNECTVCTDSWLYDQLDSIAKSNCKNIKFPISPHRPSQLDSILLRDGNPNKRTFHSLSSGLVSKRMFKYGKYEMRFKLMNSPSYSEKSRGHWQSFWLFGGTEIDIFEMENAPKNWFQKKRNYQTNLHYFEKDKDFSANYLAQRNINLDQYIQDKDSFVTAGVIWYPKGIIDDSEIALWYINDKVLKAIRFDELKNRKNKVPNYESSWMNIIIGSGIADLYDRTGKPIHVWNGPPTDKTNFPFGLKVDYVKVWQLGDLFKPISGSPEKNTWFLPRLNYEKSNYKDLTTSLLSGNTIEIGHKDWKPEWEDKFELINAYDDATIEGKELKFPSQHKTFLNFTASERIKIRGNSFKVPMGSIFKANIQEKIDANIPPKPVLMETGEDFYYEVYFNDDQSNWLTIPFEQTEEASITVYEGTREKSSDKFVFGYQSKIYKGQLPIWDGKTLKRKKWYWIEIEAKNKRFTSKHKYCIRAFWNPKTSDSIFAKIKIPPTKDLY